MKNKKDESKKHEMKNGDGKQDKKEKKSVKKVAKKVNSRQWLSKITGGR